VTFAAHNSFLFQGDKNLMADANDTKPSRSKGSKDVNKSAEVRKVAGAMKAKGEKPRPVTIIEVLRKQGIEVSSAQVSMVLKRMGFRPRRRRKSGAVATKGPGRPPKATRSKETKITLEDLVAAQKVVGSLGGIDRALATLEALRQFDT
jgi:hypothetical protein